MTIEYKIQEKDLLTLQQFIASSSESVKKSRHKNRITVPLFYVAISIVGFILDDIVLTLLFLAVAVLWSLFFPLYERKRYLNSFTTYIDEYLKDRIVDTISIEINDDFLLEKEGENEGKTATSNIQSISDIPSLIIIRLRGGLAHAIPKEQIPDIESLKNRLQKLAAHLGINYQINEKWEWK